MSGKQNRGAKGLGSIRKRADGRWEARYVVGFDPITGKPKRSSVYGKTQKEVRQQLTKISTEIDEGDYLDPVKLKVGPWLDTWLENYTINNKPATR
ncbi:MAG: site-specific integrase, partial [Oscillospiraceae bacterium]|nr:site-specific integrase [Oscillospiraceae bacterium]